jgi:7-carboxy-7-deazaguanine synthase
VFVDQSLVVNEIFYSIQGEAAYSGWPCVFVRLTGCPLRCSWCDTTYAYEEGKLSSISEVLDKIVAFHNPHKVVELTGGEPLVQSATLPLMKELISQGFTVLVETSGAVSIAEVPAAVHIIMDLKCPGSGMENRNNYKNLEYLKPTDEIKFVITNEHDFQWACDKVRQFDLEARAALLVSPAWGQLNPQQLVEWVRESGLKFRLNIQIHKYIWEPTTRGV